MIDNYFLLEDEFEFDGHFFSNATFGYNIMGFHICLSYIIPLNSQEFMKFWRNLRDPSDSIY